MSIYENYLLKFRENVTHKMDYTQRFQIQGQSLRSHLQINLNNWKIYVCIVQALVGG